ncbi:MAG: hypothetical protein Q8Q89_01765 [bacterium]|nr:hypothetical protein [bacterium]
MNKRKKIIFIFLGVLITGGVVYWFFFLPKPLVPPDKDRRPPVVTPETAPTTGETGEKPPTGEEGLGEAIPAEEEILASGERLVKLTDYPVIAPSLNKDENKVVFYKKEGGDLWSSDFTGKKKTKESSITIINLMEAVWSPDKSRAAVFYLDKETKKGFIHIGASSVSILPQDIKSFSWSPDGKSAAYLIARDKNTDLIITDNLGKNPRTVLSTPMRDIQLSWITSDKIALQSPPSGLAEGHLLVFSLSSRSLNRLASGLFGLMTLWAPDGSKFLSTVTDSFGKNLEFFVKDSSGKEIFASAFPTIPDKCFWASSIETYCALAVDFPTEAIMPDNYLSGEINTKDQIVFLNTSQKQVYSVLPDPQFDISNLLSTKKQDYLFFVNRTDGTLWSLKIEY